MQAASNNVASHPPIYRQTEKQRVRTKKAWEQRGTPEREGERERCRDERDSCVISISSRGEHIFIELCRCCRWADRKEVAPAEL